MTLVQRLSYHRPSTLVDDQEKQTRIKTNLICSSSFSNFAGNCGTIRSGIIIASPSKEQISCSTRVEHVSADYCCSVICYLFVSPSVAFAS